MADHAARTGARALCVLVLVAAAAGAAAQSRLYKSVGPDGRITWTDKPPTAEEAVRTRPGAAPAQAQAPLPGATIRAADGEIPMLAAPGAVADFEAARAAPGSRNPEAERAARVVMVQGEMVVHTLQNCGMDIPAQRRKYATTLDAWQAKHGPLFERAFAVAADLLGMEGARTLRLTALRQVDRSLARYQAATPPEKLLWCEYQWQRVDRGDLAGFADAGVPAAVQSYRLPRP